MDVSSMRLPPGYRFNPFEKELINLYLKPKVMGEKLPCNVVEETQLYGPKANPWHVFDPENHPWIISEVSPGKFEKIAFVFVNLTKKAANPNNNNSDVGRENFIKKAGCGTWDGQTKRTEIMDSNGHLIGEKRLLVFEINELVSDQDDLSRVGYWKMHEYNLCGVNKDIPNPANTVLCKITLDYSKNPPVKLRPNKPIHPTKATTSKPQKKNNKKKKKNTENVDVNVCSTNCAVVNTDQEGITENCVQGVTTQTCRDDGLISIDSYGPKGEECCYETDIVQTCDEVNVEWMNNIFHQPEIGDSQLEEVVSGPMSFDLCCPDDGYQMFVSEEGEGGNLYVNMTGFRSYPKPRYEHPREDFTANLGKRKFHAETSYALCTLHSLELNKEHFFKKLEFIMTLIWIHRDIAGGVVVLTVDHRLEENVEERERVTASGGEVGQLNVFGGNEVGPLRCWPGGLCLSRSIGDTDVGEFIVPVPHVKQVKLPNVGGRLIIASDGIWDALSSDMAAQACRGLPAELSAKLVVKEALRSRGLKDDTTCLVVDILSYDHPVLPPVVRKKNSPITSFILGKKSQSLTKKGKNNLSAVGVVEELFEEGSAMLAERLNKDSRLDPNSGLARCAICQVDQPLIDCLSDNSEPIFSSAAKPSEGPILCAKCLKKKEAMEGKQSTRKAQTA